MALTITKDPTRSLIHVTGGSQNYSLLPVYGLRQTDTGVSLTTASGEGVAAFTALNEDAAGGVAAVVQANLTSNPITTVASLYAAMKLIF